MNSKLLSQFVDQYQQRHHQLPKKIFVHPLALVALGVKRSVAPRWNGIAVECSEVLPESHGRNGGTCLGIYIKTTPKKQPVLQAFDCLCEKPIKS